MDDTGCRVVQSMRSTTMYSRGAGRRFASCRILGLGGYLPDRVLSNSELAGKFGVTEDWIHSRTGIKERRILARDEDTSDMGAAAARAALVESGVPAGEITHLLLASCSPDGLVPNTACTLEHKLGLSGLAAFDFNVACSGFLYGLYLAAAILCLEPEAKILLVAAEAMSRICDKGNLDVKALFGDGAGAAVLAGGGSQGIALLDVLLSSDGAHGQLLTADGGGSRARYASALDMVGDGYFLRMQGREVYRHAVCRLTEVCLTLLDRNGLGAGDVDLFVPHQANRRIIEAVGKRLGLAETGVLYHLEHCGNTSPLRSPWPWLTPRLRGCWRRDGASCWPVSGRGLPGVRPCCTPSTASRDKTVLSPE